MDAFLLGHGVYLDKATCNKDGPTIMLNVLV